MASCCGSAGGGCPSSPVVRRVVEAVLLLFYVMLAVTIPLIDAQVCLGDLVKYPEKLVELKVWYGGEFGDYLMAERPHFFKGLVWLELVFLWPLSVACSYGLLAGKPWFKTASLMAGVSTVTSMAAIMSELLGSGRASEKLIRIYAPFVVFAFLATLRGLCPCSAAKATSSCTCKTSCSCKSKSGSVGSSDGAHHASRKKKA